MNKNLTNFGKTKTIDDYIELGKLRGYKWTGKTLPSSTVEATEWECLNGHKSQIRYNQLLRGRRCFECETGISQQLRGTHKKTKYNKKSYRKLANKLGFLWVGENVPENGVLGLTKWQCKNKHTFESTYYSLNKMETATCPVCTFLDILNKIKQTYNIILLNENDQINIKRSREWKCQHGHIFSKSISYLRNAQLQGVMSVCDVCNGKKSEKDYHEAAHKNGIEWIGEIPSSVEKLSLWRCCNGHEWEANYHNIYWNNSKCPICAKIRTKNGKRVSYIQERLQTLIPDSELNYKIGRYSVDIALVVDRVAIEYDTYYWHRQRVDTSQTEKRKDSLLQAHGWKVIRIRSNNLLPNKEQLEDTLQQAKEGNVFQEIILPDWNQESSWS